MLVRMVPALVHARKKELTMRSPIFFCDSCTRVENFRLFDVTLNKKKSRFNPSGTFLPFSDHMHEALSQLPGKLRTCFARGTRGGVYLAGY